MSEAKRQPGVGFIFVTLVLSVVGFGLLIPVLPSLVTEFEGNNVSDGSHAYGWIISTYALMQFIGAPLMGALSDQFGRRRIILIATAGAAIDYAIMANAPTLTWFFVARAIAGFTAGVLSSANAYIADVTPPEKRAQSFGLLGAAFGIGFVIGPVVGGVLGDKALMTKFTAIFLTPEMAHRVGDYALHIPFWFAAGCAALNWFWGFLVLPESLKPENRRAFSWSRANPVGALLALKHLPTVLGLSGSYFIMMLSQTMLQSTWALYTKARYHWGTMEVGFSLMMVGVLSGAVQATLVKRIVPKIGETRAVMLGFIISICAQIGYGCATQGWMIYIILIVGAFAGIAQPALQAYITKHVPANEQGAVQGVYSGLASLAGIPGPLIGTTVLAWAVAEGKPEWLHGSSFFVGAALTAITLVTTLRIFRRDAVAAPVAAQN